MTWPLALVCVAAIIGACFIVDCICSAIRYGMGERKIYHYGRVPPPPPMGER